MEAGRENPCRGGARAGPGGWSLAGALVPAVGVISFATLTAVGARAVIHIGPVPLTLQVFFVLLAGMMLGSKLGAASQLAYVAAGLAGVPIFSSPPFSGPGYLLGPTGGYLVGFVAAAWLTGLAVERWRDVRAGDPMIIGYALAGMLGLVAIYALGAAGLALWMLNGGKDLAGAASGAWKAGVVPFMGVDVLKCVAAAAVASGALRRVRLRRG
ncbi:MAG: biotin transporter BioY [Candidatus Geothermincolia bacterium]